MKTRRSNQGNRCASAALNVDSTRFAADIQSNAFNMEDLRRSQRAARPEYMGGESADAGSHASGGSILDFLGRQSTAEQPVKANKPTPSESESDQQERESNLPEKDLPGEASGGRETGGALDWLYAASGQATESSEDPLRDVEASKEQNQSDASGMGPGLPGWWPELGGAPDDMQGCYDWATDVFTNLMNQSNGGIPDKNTFVGMNDNSWPKDATLSPTGDAVFDAAVGNTPYAGKILGPLLGCEDTGGDIAESLESKTYENGFDPATDSVITPIDTEMFTDFLNCTASIIATGVNTGAAILISAVSVAVEVSTPEPEQEEEGCTHPDVDPGMTWPKTVEGFLMMVDGLARKMNDYMNGAIDFGEFGREENHTSFQDIMNAHSFAAGTHTTPDPENRYGGQATGEDIAAGMPTEICPEDVRNSLDGAQHGQDKTDALGGVGVGKNIHLPSESDEASTTLEATFSEQTRDAVGLNDITEADYKAVAAILDRSMPVEPQSPEQWFEEATKFLQGATEAIERLIEAGTGRLWD